jgi:hypothetical protein
MTDIEITCEECKLPFTLNAAAQEYYSQTGYTQPTRCESCEAQRRKAKASEKASRRPPKRRR